MKILIPMAGEGKRFTDAGYKVSKPAILTYDRRTGNKIPMVVCAVLDLPGVEKDGNNLIFIDRLFHKAAGVEVEIKKFFPKAQFITIDGLTEGQACTCLLAKEMLDKDESVLIAGCDNGMVMDKAAFDALTDECDEIVFTYRHNEAVLKNPNAYGWMKVDKEDNVIGTSIKKTLSDTPLEDHAVVATFWFKTAKIFIDATEKMIAGNDRINHEFYMDQVAAHMLTMGYKVKVFEINRYIGWGTPADYEAYQNTYEYWKGFLKKEACIIKSLA